MPDEKVKIRTIRVNENGYVGGGLNIHLVVDHNITFHRGKNIHITKPTHCITVKSHRKLKTRDDKYAIEIDAEAYVTNIYNKGTIGRSAKSETGLELENGIFKSNALSKLTYLQTAANQSGILQSNSSDISNYRQNFSDVDVGIPGGLVITVVQKGIGGSSFNSSTYYGEFENLLVLVEFYLDGHTYLFVFENYDGFGSYFDGGNAIVTVFGESRGKVTLYKDSTFSKNVSLNTRFFNLRNVAEEFNADTPVVPPVDPPVVPPADPVDPPVVPPADPVVPPAEPPADPVDPPVEPPVVSQPVTPPPPPIVTVVLAVGGGTVTNNSQFNYTGTTGGPSANQSANSTEPTYIVTAAAAVPVTTAAGATISPVVKGTLIGATKSTTTGSIGPPVSYENNTTNTSDQWSLLVGGQVEYGGATLGATGGATWAENSYITEYYQNGAGLTTTTGDKSSALGTANVFVNYGYDLSDRFRMGGQYDWFYIASAPEVNTIASDGTSLSTNYIPGATRANFGSAFFRYGFNY